MCLNARAAGSTAKARVRQSRPIMHVRLFPTKHDMAAAAAGRAASLIREAAHRRGVARIVAATAGSQLEFLGQLASAPNVDWSRVELFHLDEYIGIPPSHPASFRGMLKRHLIDKTGITRHHLLDGDGDVDAAITEVGTAITAAPIDVAFIGIGENAHLAFNDPPADFVTTAPYHVVRLDEACRRQQVREGWFASVADVPVTALSMSIHQILQAEEILVIVPDARKAPAVRATLAEEVGPDVPSTVLRRHPHVTLFLDAPAASALEPALRARYGI
jgi:glucosamine-6-phosphate deaminase